MSTELSAKANLYTQGFSEGVQQIREKLSQLNTALEENKQELKSANSEAQKLQAAQKTLAKRMEKTGGGTDTQKKKLQELSDRLAQTTAKIGSLRAKEIELKSSVKSATKELEGQKTATKEVSVASDTAQKAVRGLSTAVKALVASAVAKSLWTSLIGSNAEMEQALTSFTVMLGDAQKAKELVEEMTDFAAHTPLELPDVTAAAQMLMNYGVAGDEVIEKLTQLGDLAGGNAVKLDRISLAYGQMLAKGKVTGEELRQMTEAGVPLLQALSNTLGVSTAEVQDMISKSKVGIDDLDRAIGSLTSDGGKFAGMMAQQSQTLTGMLSTAADTAAQFGRDVGDEAFEKVKGTLSEILAEVGRLEADGTLDEWAEKLGDNFADVVQWGKNAIEAVLSAAKPIAALTGFVLDNKEAVLAGIAAYKGFTAVQKIIEKVTAATKAYAAAQGITLVGASKTTIAATAASAGVSKLGAALSSTSVQTGLLGLAIAALVAEFNWLKQGFTVSDDVRELANSVDDLKGTVDSAVSSFEAEAAVLKTKAQAYEELRVKTDRTAVEEERLSELAEELQETLGGNCTVVNALTGEYNDLTSAVDEYIKKQSESVRLSALEEQAKEAYKVIAEIEKKIEERSKAHEQFVEDEKEKLSFWTDRGIDVNSVSFALPVETSSYLNDMKALREAKSEAEQIVADYEAAFGTYMQGISEDSETAAKEVTESSKSAALSLEEIKEASEKCKKATGELANEAKALSSAFAEQNEDGSLSVDTILSLVDAGYAAALAVDAETGAVRLNTEAYKELAKAKIEAQKADLLERRTQATQGNIEKMKLASGSGDHKRIAELQKENEDIAKEYDVQIAALDSIDLDKVTSGTYGEKKQSGASGSGNTSGGSGSNTDSEYDKERAELDYRYKMGEVEAEEYYKQLAELRDKYLEENSAEWRAVNTEIYNYQKKLAEDAEKEAEEAAKNAAENIKEYYSGVNEAFQEAADERIKIIDKELAAKKKASDEAIAAIDAEIEARKRANEDEDIQREIDAVKAQLNYAQLDDFSRLQLERKLGNLYDEQAEMIWERGAADRKAAISSEYSAAEDAANAEKERISEAADHVEEALGRAADGISLCAGEIARAAGALGGIFGSVNAFTGTTINNYSTSAGERVFNTSVSFAQQPFTLSQIAQAVIDAIKGSPIF